MKSPIGLFGFDLEINRHRIHNNSDLEDDRGPLQFHRSLPGYRSTPLHDLPELAELLQVRSVWAKDESLRLGLPSFKILGVSWAVHRALAERTEQDPHSVALVAATNGNHGRAVARVAKHLGMKSKIFVPAGLNTQQERAIAGEGAQVTRVDGGYDAAVKRAASLASDQRLVISDTSWPGYTQIPSWIVEGYSTIFWEVDDALERLGELHPTLIAAQIGVGSLAASVVRHYHRSSATIFGVEPRASSSLLQSVRKGSLVSQQPRHESVMTGLNCGVPSHLAWPVLRAGIDAFVAIGDQSATRGVELLAELGLRVGATGAAGLAGLVELFAHPESKTVRRQLGIGDESNVLLLLTEGSRLAEGIVQDSREFP